MRCDQCNAADAAIHLTRIDDGRKVERHLCAACAAAETGGQGGSIAETLREWVKREREKQQKPRE
jgi:protein-arginine kinase activator protein McsA